MTVRLSKGIGVDGNGWTRCGAWRVVTPSRLNFIVQRYKRQATTTPQQNMSATTRMDSLTSSHIDLVIDEIDFDGFDEITRQSRRAVVVVDG